ncbi:glycosyl hydrolase family 28-related protein [Phascolarctobacterium succinatutens]|uniref:glycosyl hydrolase family 28-related protein n=1 Tax=Phascolarctobacterium succinatutens TaxID=626940 RepID=UPI0026EAD948|nr:glycosyl hydrolase family 28-related protein [Phascolarctobacterium succinatutens]
MTVQKDVTKNIYVGNGSTRTFPFTFECPAEHPEYIKVYLMQDDGTALATSDYQLDMDARQITYPSSGTALPEGKKLVIMRELPLQQMMNLVNNGPYFPEDVETAFDENVMAMQQIAEKLNRSIIMSVDIDGDAFVNEVPFEAGKSFRIADDGKSIVLTEDPGKVIDEAKGLAEETATNAQEAKQAAAEIKTIYNSGGLTPITDLAGSIGTAIKRWGYIFANKVFAMNLPIVYKSVAEMKADSLLSAGMTACTLGYYAPNDGGGATYIIRAKQESDVDDGGSLHTLANGNVAELVVENGMVNVKQFGAKGDGVTDDTDAFQKINGKVCIIPNGTFIVSSVTYGKETQLKGTGIGKCVIKQIQNCNQDMLVFKDAVNAELTNVLLLGRANDNNEDANIHTYEKQALLKISADVLNGHGCRFEHIRIMWSNSIGMFIGSENVVDANNPKHNWVYQFNDIRIEYCKRYCLYDKSTDNRFSNFYLSEGGLACFYAHGVTNVYNNFKIDQPYSTFKSEAYGTIDGVEDGAAMLILGNGCIFTNFDIQSPNVVGLKCRGKRHIFEGLIQNNGWTKKTDGVALIAKDAQNCTFRFSYTYSTNISTKNKYCVKILDGCRNVVCYLQGDVAPYINNNTTTCSVIYNGNAQAQNYNMDFIVNRKIVNSHPAPLIENIKNATTVNVTIDTEHKVVGSNSLKMQTDDGYANIDYVLKVDTDSYYLLAIETYIEKEGTEANNTSVYLASNQQIYNRYYSTPNKVGRHICYLVAKTSDSSTLTMFIHLQNPNSVVYVGNLLVWKISGSLLDSKLNTDDYAAFYDYLSNHIGEEFGTLNFPETVAVRDIMASIKRLME